MASASFTLWEMSFCGLVLTAYVAGSHTERTRNGVIKHGLLENALFSSVIFRAKSTSIHFVDFPASHGADDTRG